MVGEGVRRLWGSAPGKRESNERVQRVQSVRSGSSVGHHLPDSHHLTAHLLTGSSKCDDAHIIALDGFL